jgi:hypothetical protein
VTSIGSFAAQLRHALWTLVPSRFGRIRQLLAGKQLRRPDWFNPFPEDGRWYKHPVYIKVAKEVLPDASSEVLLSRANARLQSLFTAEWARGVGDPPYHPFAFQYSQRGYIREILELGVCLDAISSPPEIAADITAPSRYESRAFEAWAGALFVHLGASVQFIREKDILITGKRPEFEARFIDGTIAVEVKAPSLGDLNEELQQGSIDLLFTIMHRKQLLSSQDFGRLRRSHAIILPHVSEIVLAMAKRHDFEERCRKLGDDLLDEWLQNLEVATSASPYRSERLEVHILEAGQPDSGEFYWTGVPVAPAKHSFRRVRRNLLADAAKKLANWQMPGIIVLGERTHGWHPDILEMMRKDLNRKQPWTANVGAVFVKPRRSDTVAFISVLQGPRWDDLPLSLTRALSICGKCDDRHIRFDPLVVFAQPGSL